METNKVFFDAARRHLATLQEAYGFTEDHTEFEGTQGTGGILVLRSPTLRLRIVLDKGPQVWLDLAPSSGDWCDVALLAEWLGQKAKADAATGAMPPADTPEPWAPLDSRIKVLADVALELMPDLTRVMGDPRWPETATALAVLREARFKESQTKLRQRLQAKGGSVLAPARAGLSVWLVLIVGLLSLIRLAYTLLK